MAKNEAPPRHDWHTGLTGDEDIPPFLEVKNRVPLTEAQRARLAAQQAKAKVADESHTWGSNLPRGVEDDPVAMALLNAKVAEQVTAKAARLAALKANKPAAPKAVRSGLLDAHHFAQVIGCQAKLVRRALRTTKAIPKPAWGWAFAPADEARVVEVVKAWLQKTATPAVKAKAPPPAAKLPPPAETVWTGKAKVKRTKTEPPQQHSAKAEQRKALQGKKKKKGAK